MTLYGVCLCVTYHRLCASACCTTAERGQAFQSVADRQSPIGLGKPLLLHLANMPLSPLVRVLLARPPNDYRLD